MTTLAHSYASKCTAFFVYPPNSWAVTCDLFQVSIAFSVKDARSAARLWKQPFLEATRSFPTVFKVHVKAGDTILMSKSNNYHEVSSLPTFNSELFFKENLRQIFIYYTDSTIFPTSKITINPNSVTIVLYTVATECRILIFKLFCSEEQNSKQYLLPLTKKQTH